MKKNRTILIFILSTLITIFVVCLLVFFLKIIENKNKHISAVIGTIEEKLKEKENVTIFAEKISEITLLQNSINSHFVDSNKIDSLVNYLEDIDLGIGSEVLIKNIEILQNPQNIISFKILITGTFEQIMKTITFLENIPYMINITQVSLNKNFSPEPTREKTETYVFTMPTWQADVSFNVLSSN